jgi:hypothetical protein
VFHAFATVAASLNSGSLLGKAKMGWSEPRKMVDELIVSATTALKSLFSLTDCILGQG